MSDVIHALRRETVEARALLANLKDIIGDDQSLAATTVEGETSLHDAVRLGLMRLLELEAIMHGIAGLIANLKDRGERLAAQRDNIRTAICAAMDAGQMKRFEHALGTISLKSVPPKVVIVDDAAIPSRFWKTGNPNLDRVAILGALNANEAVPGAQLSNGSQTIQIKVD